MKKALGIAVKAALVLPFHMILGTLFLAFAAELPVFAGTTLVVPTQYSTIQSAIDAASPGDTVAVLPGIYQEQITISKDLTLVGAGLRPSVIQAPTSLNPTTFGATYIVRINNGAQVSMARMVVSGPGPGACASLTLGVLVYENATLRMKESVVAHIRDNPLSSCPFGGGVGVGVPKFMGGGSVGHAVIRYSLFYDYQSEAIGVVGPGSTATIANNLITGSGHTSVRQQNGVFVTASAVATVTGNIITGNLCDIAGFCGDNPMGQGQSSGVFAARAGAGTVISGNYITGNDVGVYVYLGQNCCQTTSNTLKNNRYFGVILQDADNSASNNKISGGETGIGVVADFVNVTGTLTGNTISATSIAPVQTLSCCGVQATAIVQ